MNPPQIAEAEALALRVLEWLAGTEDLLGVFLGATGMSPEELVETASGPETLAAVVDFLLQDDRWVLECAEQLHVNPEEFARARRFLPGGDSPYWT